jgi:CRISPR-associated exonuclease Cas4
MQESMSNNEELDQVMISALEHYSYCPRQCALIHIEQTFDENIYTLRGHFAHERVDQVITRYDDTVRIERALPLWSRRLGLIGRADVVEFHDGVPYPVEYKLGKRREWLYEAIQVCAQALCLEEMFGIAVPQGAIYYCGSRTRREVPFDESLCMAVERTTQAVRAMLYTMHMPPAVNDQRCHHCSLLDSCLPDVVIKPGRLQRYRSSLFEIEEVEGKGQ